MAVRQPTGIGSYRADPILIAEHANIERATAQGGYGRRQLYELVQNGADALLCSPGGHIHILLTEEALYCANEGAPVGVDGVDAIMHSHISWKRGAEIGRFGLGFKSVLGVSTRPEFYSRTGSFGFDADEADRRIRAEVPDAEVCPKLRIAVPLDPAQAANLDPCLADLMTWAVSVIKLPRDVPVTDWLSEDIECFPARFLLFCSHVGSLVLEDRTRSVRREIRVRAESERILLEEGDQASIWRVFETWHEPSDLARKDAGELAERDRLQIMWAVPLHGRVERGELWAFFPTEYRTTLSGIVNAPWKTNEDRQNLLTGPFNEELIDAAAELVAGNLVHLVDGEDPGRVLDLLPARGREAPNWADERLTEQVYEAATVKPVIPDQDGRLRLPTEIRLQPDTVPREALLAWESYSDRPRDWCHRSAVETASRRSRVERLLRLVWRSPAELSEWLEALVSQPDPAASRTAIISAARVLDAVSLAQRNTYLNRITDARILLTASGNLVYPRPSTVFIAPEAFDPEAPFALVHPDVAADDTAVAALAALGIGEVDAASELEALLARLRSSGSAATDWAHLWRTIRRLGTDAATEVLKRHVPDAQRMSLHVRTISEGWAPLNLSLLPGPVVPADGSRDAAVAIDVEFHAHEVMLLREVGATDVPRLGSGSLHEVWFGEYRADAVQAFVAALPKRSSRPYDYLLRFDRSRCVGPLQILYELSDEGRARYTEELLLAGQDEPHWTMRHSTRGDHYPEVAVEPPHIWLIRRKGRLRTQLGCRPVLDCVGPTLRKWSGILAVADCTEEAARKLDLPASLDQLTEEQWGGAWESATDADDERRVWEFYAAACESVAPPAVLRCRIGEARSIDATSGVAVTWERTIAESLSGDGTPYIQVPSREDAERLIRLWGLQSGASLITIDLRCVPSGTETPVLDRFPGLEGRLEDEQGELQLIPCSFLRLETTTSSGWRPEDRECVREGNVVYYADRLCDTELLDGLTSVLGLDLEPGERRRILEQRELASRRERLHAVRKSRELPARLIAAVGADAIRRRLPTGLVAAALTQHGTVDDELAAQFALGVYGVQTLNIFREELKRNGLEPPHQWAGSHSARRFVRDLGFPAEFAGFRQATRDPVLEVEGPPNLPQLHDFQEILVARIRGLVREGARRRGLMSLPTGAGKTRVAVQALVTAVKEDGLTGPILWIAHSDELCEQAVQTWSEVWRAIGPQHPLHVHRLWASNEADPYLDGTQVVVATRQKLQGCMGDKEYEWLAQATCTIIDEAHTSVTTDYTAILRWLGLGRGKDRCPLIGLTATPFRGGEDETRLLVSRYGRNRVDEGVLSQDPYIELQEMGVLARVDHELLDGVTVDLAPSDIEYLRRTSRLPATAEAALGADVSRNEMLLRSVGALPTDWPVLLFAASVDHARTLAALLNAAGVRSAAVSAETEPRARRHYIEQFRRGSLRVLTNYNVLTAGFDAPAVRALYVARPTFSPVLYQQMIGRGLRGPKNGGKDRCLVVNVKDNFLQYGEDLAFRGFEYLWSRK
jgi:superfamily II DNA or RNA helicase